MTLLVRGTPIWLLSGSCAATMNCSFRTSYGRVRSIGCIKESVTHQHTNGGIVVRVVDIIRYLFNNLEQHSDKVVVDVSCAVATFVRSFPPALHLVHTQVIDLNLLDARHLIQQLHEKSVYPFMAMLLGACDQIHQPRKCAFVIQ